MYIFSNMDDMNQWIFLKIQVFFMREKNKEKNEGCAIRNKKKKKRKIKIDRNGMQRSPRT